MKKTPVSRLLLSASLLVLAGVLAPSSVHAGETVKKETKASKKTVEKYDRNHNGVLDPDEEAALQADREKARAERKKKKEDGAADRPN